VRSIGILLSPYVRRVAVGLNILQLPFEHEGFVFGEPISFDATIRLYNDRQTLGGFRTPDTLPPGSASDRRHV
jgi:hypothetical protein